jgi:hypothetical protein
MHVMPAASMTACLGSNSVQGAGLVSALVELAHRTRQHRQQISLNGPRQPGRTCVGGDALTRIPSSSTSSFRKTRLGCFSASSADRGAIARQGPHQVAKKSATTFVGGGGGDRTRQARGSGGQTRPSGKGLARARWRPTGAGRPLTTLSPAEASASFHSFIE